MACHLGKKDFSVRVWDRDTRRAMATELERESPRYLPGVKLPISVGVGSDLSSLLDGAEVVVLAVPVPSLRGVLEAHRTLFRAEMTFVSLSKGIEFETGMRVSEVAADVLGEPFRGSLTVLSGPNLAAEVARESPTSSVVAGVDPDRCARIQKDLASPAFRVYTSSDVVGVELGGALKNIVAIACGIVDELGFGNNTRGALMTRGLAEMTRLGVALGAQAMTFLGLSGMGDLVATCTSELSRNHTTGRFLARGLSLEEISGRMSSVSEGVNTTRSVKRLAQRLGVPMPITDQIHAILFEGKDPHRALRDLMVRDLKREDEFPKSGPIQ